MKGCLGAENTDIKHTHTRTGMLPYTILIGGTRTIPFQDSLKKGEHANASPSSSNGFAASLLGLRSTP